MQNCSGRAAFNMNYTHDDLRTPNMLLQQDNRGGAAGLSINAPEFVPKRPGGPPMAANVGPHHAYPPQQQQSAPPAAALPLAAYQQVNHLPQQPQPQQQQHLPHQPALYHQQQQQQHHHHNNHMQHQQQNRRGGGNGGNGGNGGGRHNLQERLNPFADNQQQHVQQQQQQQPQQHHHHQQQQHNNHHHHHHQQQQQQHHQQQPYGVPAAHVIVHRHVQQQQQQPHLMYQQQQPHHQQQQQQQVHHQQQQHHHHHQDRRGNGGGRHAVDNGGAYGADQEDENPTEAQMGALAHLTQVIGKLLDDPGMFEACQKELNAVYIEFAQNRFVISNSIEILFTQSIDEPNFRYMGARVCRLLDGIVATPDSIFRELLSFKMQDTQHQNKVFIKNEANKVRGSALFLGELFLQLQNDGTRIAAIAENIHKTLEELLQKLTPENIKCVCQTLKLCGYELEMDCPAEVTAIINVLRQQKDVDVSTERLINSVLDLQANRWGRNEAASLASSVHIDHNSQQAFTNDPVFYGPDGKIITEEESSFLSGILTAATDNVDDEDDLDPGMDDEMKLAFKDFVKFYSK